ncbi:MAG: FUSC family protein [Synechococcaceae cyanobacterium]
MLITRSDLRLALVAGLTNGLGAISGIPFSYYAPMAVLAVCGGSYGNTLELGRQRLLGSLLGGAMLTLGLRGLQQLPLPVALAISLGAMRLLGGALGLRVGYKVGGFVVVMGWLVHRQTLLEWLPLRLVWTACGIVLASLSLRLLWPAKAIVASETAMATLIEGLAAVLATAATSLDPPPGSGDAGPPRPPAPIAAAPGRAPAPDPSPPGLSDLQALLPHPEKTESLIAALEAIRRSLPQAQQELGANPERHPRIRLLRLLDASCSQLLGVYDELARQPLPPICSGNLAEVPVVEAALLRELSQRLGQWAAALRQPQRQDWRQPQPAAASPESAWRRLDTLLHQRDLPERDLPDLRRHAAILSLLGLAAQQLHETEESWRNLGRRA